MKSVHDMPFGARLCSEGVRFSLWAPGAAKVELMIDAGEAQSMEPTTDGWFEHIAPDIRAGARYAYRINETLIVPDPASRFQPDGPLASSMVVDPTDYDWADEAWRGLPWEEAIIWEAHVGTASTGGSYIELAEKLPKLAALGVTAIELMPLSDCPGMRNWGYDGVLPFAPNHSYGSPTDLKRLIDRAHALKIMVFLDVVYNHFGPSGNFLPGYAAAFFNAKEATPWGAAINFDGLWSRHVRDFFIHNALYWLSEHHFDGLRFDAVHAIVDHSDPCFLDELALRIKRALPDRRIHLVLENEKNEARRLTREKDGGARRFVAQWNDDIHHCWHRLLTGESEGYYEDFDRPAHRLGRGLAEGFVYQGEPSRHAGGKVRGEPSAALPPTAFIAFLQSHDQIGNRALGERIAHLAPPERVALAHAVLLLAPQIPMIFMGEEWDASSPFLYFVDFAGDPALSKAVRDGRRSEFARFAAFADPHRAEFIPDPTADATFMRSKIDWSERTKEPHFARLTTIRDLLRIRRDEIVPLIASPFIGATHKVSKDGLVSVVWRFGAGALRLFLQLGATRVAVALRNGERPIWASPTVEPGHDQRLLPSWTALFVSGSASND